MIMSATMPKFLEDFQRNIGIKETIVASELMDRRQQWRFVDKSIDEMDEDIKIT